MSACCPVHPMRRTHRLRRLARLDNATWTGPSTWCNLVSILSMILVAFRMIFNIVEKYSDSCRHNFRSFFQTFGIAVVPAEFLLSCSPYFVGRCGRALRAVSKAWCMGVRMRGHVRLCVRFLFYLLFFFCFQDVDFQHRKSAAVETVSTVLVSCHGNFQQARH